MARPRKEFVGKTWGDFTPLYETAPMMRAQRFICRCICGGVYVLRRSQLELRPTCSHIRVTLPPVSRKFPKITKEKRKRQAVPEFQTYYRNYQKGAENRNYQFHLSYDEFVMLVHRECHYCGSPPRRLSQVATPVNGIDRIHNEVGYQMDNCVTCCTACNRMKRDIPLVDFLDRVSRIYLKCIVKNESLPLRPSVEQTVEMLLRNGSSPHSIADKINVSEQQAQDVLRRLNAPLAGLLESATKVAQSDHSE